MNAQEIDAHLDDATIKVLTWKPGTARNIAVAILGHIVGENDRIIWPDQIDTRDVVAGDRNAIGLTWRTLVKVGILKRTECSRRSTADGSRGRTIFSYRLVDESKARTFLKRNGWSPTKPIGQQEFAALTEAAC
jgi:hypothetical protein